MAFAAVFPTLALHDSEAARGTHVNHQDSDRSRRTPALTRGEQPKMSKDVSSFSLKRKSIRNIYFYFTFTNHSVMLEEFLKMKYYKNFLFYF